MKSEHEFCFGPYLLNTGTRELHRGGDRLAVPPLVLNLIIALLRHRDRVVGKDELIHMLWTDGSASDSSLAQAVRRARQILDDSDEEPRWIRTVRRTGYRFIGEVEVTRLTGRRSSDAESNDDTRPAMGVRERATGLHAHNRQDTTRSVAWRESRLALTRIRVAFAGAPALFVEDGVVADLELALPATLGADTIDAQVHLAWHLRQRNAARALSLLDDAEGLLRSSHRSNLPSIELRVRLVRAEIAALSGDLHVARESGLRILAVAEQAHDRESACDACWLLALVAQDQGRLSERDSHQRAAVQYAEQSNDHERLVASRLKQALSDVSRDARIADEQWGPWLRGWRHHPNRGLAAMGACFYAYVAAAEMDLVRSIAETLAAQDGFAATGQLRELALARTCIALQAMNIADTDTAAEWLSSTLDVLRPLGWPVIQVTVLRSMGWLLYNVGQYEAAREIVEEAVRLQAPWPRSESMGKLQYLLGRIELADGQPAKALECYLKLDRTAREIRCDRLQQCALSGRASALLSLGRAEEACAAAHESLELVARNPAHQWGLHDLMTLAEAHSNHALPAPVGCTAASPTLHFLLLALERVQTKGGKPSSQLLKAIAAEHARLGDYTQAYERQSQASDALAREQDEASVKRTIAMKVRHDTDRMRDDAEFHRKVATANVHRAQALAEINDTLEKLSAMGQDITNRRDTAEVVETFSLYVHSMLDAASLAIYEVDRDGQRLVPLLDVEGRERLRLEPIALSDTTSFNARCAREKRELSIATDAASGMNMPGTKPMRSALFTPLLVGQQLIGVATIQSIRPGGYGEREQLVFRSLCAYASIALDNAHAYRDLQLALDELERTERELQRKTEILSTMSGELLDANEAQPLVGPVGRTFFLQQIERVVARCQRDWRAKFLNGSPMSCRSLVFFAIGLNEGKSAIDEPLDGIDHVLAQMAERATSVFRQSDLIVRWSVDEILAVTTQSDADQACAMAERLCEAIGNRPLLSTGGGLVQRTWSVGVSTLPFLPEQPDAVGWSTAIQLAEAALHEAGQTESCRWCVIAEGGGTRLVDVIELLSLERRDRANAAQRCRIRFYKSSSARLVTTC